MAFRTIRLVASGVFIAMTLSASGSGQPAPGAGDYGTPRPIVRAPEHERYAHLGWPKIASAPDGTLVLAYVAGRSHTAGGCPAVSISTDNGRTFTAPHILMEFGENSEYRHSGNLALGVAEDGAIVLLAMAFTGNERNTIYGWRSTDSGRTWERVNTFSLGNNRTGSVYGHVFPVADRGLAVCGHYRQPKGFGIWIAFSADDGRTWGPPRTISDRKLFEPAFTFADGRLIGLVRDNPAHGYRQFVSDDLGETWEEPRLVMQGPAAGHPSPFIAADPQEPSTLYALESQRTHRGEIYLWSADAGELQWQRNGLVATFEGCEDYSYPWMAHIGGDQWFVVFYAGTTSGANSICGMPIEVE